MENERKIGENFAQNRRSVLPGRPKVSRSKNEKLRDIYCPRREPNVNCQPCLTVTHYRATDPNQLNVLSCVQYCAHVGNIQMPPHPPPSPSPPANLPSSFTRHATLRRCCLGGKRRRLKLGPMLFIFLSHILARGTKQEYLFPCD